MRKIKIRNLSKKNISKKVSENLGVSHSFAANITNNLILIIRNCIKYKKVNIKNFGSFKILYKKERLGRNPKTLESHKIIARKSLSFIPAKKINKKIN